MKTPEEQTATHTPTDEPTNGVPQAPATPAKVVPPMTKEEFDRKNERRLALIHKKFHVGGLTPDEEREFERLQDETAAYIDAVYPLPFHVLDELRELARREGLLDPKTDPHPAQ